MAADASITVTGGDVTALLSWLRGERALAGRVSLIRTPPGDGELGGAIDMLTVALGSGGVAVALANCLTTWIRSRQRKVSLTIEGTGGRLTITSEGPADLMPLLCEILGERDEWS
jgi:hypothetical protein